MTLAEVGAEAGYSRGLAAQRGRTGPDAWAERIVADGREALWLAVAHSTDAPVSNSIESRKAIQGSA